MAVDYTGIATLVASLTASAVTLISLMRQGRNKASTDEKLETIKASTDAKLEVLHSLTNGQSEKVIALSQALGVEQGKVMGADQERANPTGHVP